MISECRIYKPDENGKLVKVNTHNAQECLNKFWANAANHDAVIAEVAKVKTCKKCGKEFQTGQRGQIYCGNIAEGETKTCIELKNIERAKKKQATQKANREKMPKKTCPVCQKKFKPTQGNSRYCNNPCTNVDYQKTKTQKHAKKQGKKWRPPIRCHCCNIMFVPDSSISRFCGNPCNLKTYKKKQSEAIRN